MKTQLLEIDPGSYDAAKLQPAVELLAAGGLVAFPTETVYGLGATDAGLARLRALKERPDAPFTLHIANRAQLEARVPELEPLARRLIERFWPGPLTLIVEVPGGTLGLRMPATRLSLDLIGMAGPLWAPSANPKGREPALRSSEVQAYFDGQIDCIVTGVCPGGSSTVVRLRGDQLEIVREGPISAAALERVRRPLVMFVCTGNTCRSPLAEVIGRARFEGLKGRPLVDSAGTMAYQGAPASPQSVEVARERGLDLRAHQSQPLTVDLLIEADLILTMTRSHLASLLQMVPEVSDKAFTLAGERDIADPYGGSIDEYRAAAEQIEEAIEAAVGRFEVLEEESP